jgi:hypothetical protein
LILYQDWFARVSGWVRLHYIDRMGWMTRLSIRRAIHVMVEHNDRTHILRSWHEWELGGRERRIVLVVETDLEMRPEGDNFDADLMDQVRAAAVAEMRASPSAIHMVRIIPARD